MHMEVCDLSTKEKVDSVVVQRLCGRGAGTLVMRRRETTERVGIVDTFCGAKLTMPNRDYHSCLLRKVASVRRKSPPSPLQPRESEFSCHASQRKIHASSSIPSAAYSSLHVLFSLRLALSSSPIRLCLLLPDGG